ncbi:MAG: hypothetical protein DRP60_09440, partial [Spirochaetes bacterium]
RFRDSSPPVSAGDSPGESSGTASEAAIGAGSEADFMDNESALVSSIITPGASFLELAAQEVNNKKEINKGRIHVYRKLFIP